MCRELARARKAENSDVWTILKGMEDIAQNVIVNDADSFIDVDLVARIRRIHSSLICGCAVPRSGHNDIHALDAVRRNERLQILRKLWHIWIDDGNLFHNKLHASISQVLPQSLQSTSKGALQAPFGFSDNAIIVHRTAEVFPNR